MSKKNAAWRRARWKKHQQMLKDDLLKDLQPDLHPNQRKWIEALLSEQYAQHRYSLRYKDQYCCLGVACDIYQKENHDLVVTYDKTTQRYSYDGSELGLPVKVQKWLGVSTPSGEVGFFARDEFASIKMCPSLSNLNDRGAKFIDIACVINEYGLR